LKGPISEGELIVDSIVRIRKDDLIVVCDSRKALLLRNTGPLAQPDLAVVDHIEADDSAQERLDGDRPGRRADGNAAALRGPRSAMETRNVGDLLAASFAKSLAERLVATHRKSCFATLLTVAPPAFLGLLRPELKACIPGITIKEIDKHLTELPVSQLQKALIDCLS
jgi:protein required for attachment to host cells